MMHPFAQLEKTASVGKLLGVGVKNLWQNGAWKTLGKLAEKGVTRGGRIGAVASKVLPVTNIMGGKTGDILGYYGLAGLASPAFGVNLPGSDLAATVGTPIIGAMNAASNIISASRANSAQGQRDIQADVQAGADRATRDFISGLHIDPRTAYDVNSYRNFAGQIGHDMGAADTYTQGGYKPITGLTAAQKLFGNSQDLIQNRARMKIQEYLPSMMKGASVGKLFGNALKALTVGGATVGLGSSIFGKKPYDPEAMQNEGYAAAQAAIQNRLRNMSGMQRMAVRLDPTLAADAIAKQNPTALKQWEAQHGPLQRGMLASTLDAFRSGGNTRFYSTDAGGNKNFIN